MTKKFGAGIALGVLGTLLVAIAIWLTVAYTGIYNVAASAQHADPVRWTFETTMRRSVTSRAGGVEFPDDISEDLVTEGAALYAENCAHCHGTPGGEPAEWSRGMRPEPPHLVEAATEWTPEEIYWIVDNGIKMSGMPAFGGHHSSEEMVALTAFVSALPGLTADDYASLTGSADGSAAQAPPAGGEADGEPQPEAPAE
ncbi:c-type cytochrome [Jannaschia rubra]|uniref:Putative bifunctional cbb3-type cytochrome c oxidase subunit II/cytochrome c n=1 Tax=Jannaschia rubra TaxID=282197 RepID=A0A0M6XW58_9RHOB|nr:cytochrome c [Jannaschia rubra]CTQ34533.1 putative bifunctional cbb3-type cytochrome c oxidase subunit II/cytochrome c [Jannaschia rubra]